MELSSSTGKVVLRGSSGVELASALNWYLKDFLNITYDWATYAKGQWYAVESQLPLPPQDVPLRKERQLEQSYYLNVCTPGYSLAWSNWSYMEKHIDWMALNGINLPLSLTGLEYVWQQVWGRFNITAEELTTTFFSGPAFLPWQRMGNIQGWGGPLRNSWIVSQRDLQKKILERERSLGMRPVLSAFAGFVPRAFARKYPNARVSQSADWNNFGEKFSKVLLLEPTDPMFKEVGETFIRIQTEIYGTDNIYSCDTYNEMDPPSGDLDALKASSAAVFEAMQAADSKAVWLMQGWLFLHSFWSDHPQRIEAYLSGAPTPTAQNPSGMWVLDLFGSTHPLWNATHSYYGKPFILCTLVNFGGQQGLFGSMSSVESNVEKVLQANENGEARGIGVGITMEGIWTNYGVFEKALHSSWDLQKESVERFAIRRYGGASEGAMNAWRDSLWPLYHGDEESASCGPGSSISSLPSIHSRTAESGATGVGTEPRSMLHYYALRQAGATLERAAVYESMMMMKNMNDSSNSSVMRNAWTSFMESIEDLGSVMLYRFDVIDVARCVIASNFSVALDSFKAAFTAHDKESMAQLALMMLNIIDDYDDLLSSSEYFMLGRWISWARNSIPGASKDEMAWLEMNARNQITLWGPRGEINDYAKKEWGGLVRAYYKKRYSLFFDIAIDVVKRNSTWSQLNYSQAALQIGIKFYQEQDHFAPTPDEGKWKETLQVLWARYIGA